MSTSLVRKKSGPGGWCRSNPLKSSGNFEHFLGEEEGGRLVGAVQMLRKQGFVPALILILVW
ncbi:hypothetical protein LZD49_13575 [Dyadobacter sp. CY261]|uniref:hypothetical protein n=1 Tax=Dyadobacter sp. CY261 TaxID=2907203 RepID=UPI001F3A725F|nr:hypothetical protein [Dyadobacter sp. CY261]MCF0071505.1 hypothetical protein [Dyadobacter sp. CY261]